MVYCTRCGTLNSDSATNCSNCGAPLITAENRPYTHYSHHHYYEEDYGYRHHGSGFGLLIAGLIIILIGLAALTGTFTLFWTYFWPLVLVIIGIWLLVWGLRRTRRYRQPPPP